MQSFYLQKNAAIKFASPNDGKHYFFGYYDKSPWSKDGRFVLMHRADFLDHLPNGREAVEICLVDFGGDKIIKGLSKTFAWNWQQGSMLQWLGPDFNENIIFNDLKDGKFVSIIYNIKTRQEKIINFPIYSIHTSGELALSLNFSRLDYLREGYGYKGLNYQNKEEDAPERDGIYSVNLKNGETKLLLPFSDLCNFKNPISKNQQAKHWVEHIMFNPSGTRFAFIHRFQLEGNRMYSRLLTANFDGTDLRVLLDTGMASHFSWKNNEEVLVWGRSRGIASNIEKSRFLNKFSLKKQLLLCYHRLNFAKNFIRQRIAGDSFLLIRDDNSGNYVRVGLRALNEDGHCTFSPDKKWILTDSYPDENHFRKLILYNFDTGWKLDAGKFYSLPDKHFCENIADYEQWDLSAMRCDLHPRWNNDGSKICIDSVHEGHRGLYIIDISKILFNI